MFIFIQFYDENGQRNCMLLTEKWHNNELYLSSWVPVAMDWEPVFTALHEMQTRSSDENSVRPSLRPSVCLSVCHTRVLWQNGRKICPDFYTIRKNI